MGQDAWASPCKMLSLAKKLKMPKRCEKRLYDHTRVIVFKKPLQKTRNIRKMIAFWKWQKLAKFHGLYSLCKMVSLGQKVEMLKRREKRFYDHIRLVVCKKPIQKMLHIRKITAFWKWQKLAKMHVQNAQLK